MRIYSYIYHLILALLMLGVAVVVLIGGSNNLRLRMLPWTGETLTYGLLWAGIIGLVAVLLAITGLFRFLFPIWALVAFVMLAKGYFVGPYTFAGKNEFYWVIALVLGALLAFLGSLTVLRARRTRRV